MSDAFWIALPGTIGALGALYVSLKGNKKVDEVHKMINSGLTIRVDEAKQLGNKEGRLEQIDIQEEKDKGK